MSTLTLLLRFAAVNTSVFAPCRLERFTTTIHHLDVRAGSTWRFIMRSVFPSAAALHHVVEEFDAIEGGKQTLQRYADYVAACEAHQRMPMPCPP